MTDEDETPLLTGADMLEAFDRDLKEGRETVYVEGDAIIIRYGAQSTGVYDVELNRCDTPEKILSWICQLLGKTWMTNLILDRFITLASENAGIKRMRI